MRSYFRPKILLVQYLRHLEVLSVDTTFPSAALSLPDPVKDTDRDIVDGTFWLTKVVLVFLLAVTTLRAATLEGKFRSEDDDDDNVAATVAGGPVAHF